MASSDGESRELSFFAQEKQGKGKSRKSVYFDRTEMPEIIIAGISGM